MLSLMGVMALSLSLSAQFVPGGISYQAIARETGGDEIINQNLTVRVGIIKSIPDGDLVYEEIHDVITNPFGLFVLTIGGGVPTGNAIYPNLADIPFESDAHFMRIDIDTPQSTGFEFLGVSELLAVPYAFHANTANSATEVDGDISNELINSISLEGTILQISEAGADHEVDLASIASGGGGSGINALITSMTLNGTNLNIVQNGVTHVADLTPLISSSWQISGADIVRPNGKVGIATTAPHSTLHADGSLAAAISVFNPGDGNIPTSYTLGNDQYAAICNVTNGAAVVTLPSASSCSGRMYQLRKFHSGMGMPHELTISAMPGDSIDGQMQLQFNTPFAEYITVVATANGWYVLNYSISQ